MTDETNDLGRIGTWLDDFFKDENETTYIAFLRLLREYYALQSQVADDALEREKRKNK